MNTPRSKFLGVIPPRRHQPRWPRPRRALLLRLMPCGAERASPPAAPAPNAPHPAPRGCLHAHFRPIPSRIARLARGRGARAASRRPRRESLWFPPRRDAGAAGRRTQPARAQGAGAVPLARAHASRRTSAPLAAHLWGSMRGRRARASAAPATARVPTTAHAPTPVWRVTLGGAYRAFQQVPPVACQPKALALVPLLTRSVPVSIYSGLHRNRRAVAARRGLSHGPQGPQRQGGARCVERARGARGAPTSRAVRAAHLNRWGARAGAQSSTIKHKRCCSATAAPLQRSGGRRHQNLPRGAACAIGTRYHTA